ncbi:MAG: HAD family hydrolase [Alphaproteobacteria bacterium]|nr:HAD family hydrolase [Alphaproteobacteria bacterium]
MSKNRKLVVWDWNGTLLDDTDLMLVCVNIILERMNRAPITMERFRETQMKPLKNFYLAVGVDEKDIPHVLEQERTLFHDHYEPMAIGAPLRDGATDLLAALNTHGTAGVIVSNHITGEIIRLLKQHDIHHHFDEVIAYESRGVQFREPKGEKLHAYIAANGLNDADGIIIGDTVEEMEIARALGMASVAITGGIQSESRLRAAHPDHIVHSLHELKPVFQERGFAP